MLNKVSHNVSLEEENYQFQNLHESQNLINNL